MNILQSPSRYQLRHQALIFCLVWMIGSSHLGWLVCWSLSINSSFLTHSTVTIIWSRFVEAERTRHLKLLTVAHKNQKQKIAIMSGIKPSEFAALISAVYPTCEGKIITGLRSGERVFSLDAVCSQPQLLTADVLEVVAIDKEKASRAGESLVWLVWGGRWEGVVQWRTSTQSIKIIEWKNTNYYSKWYWFKKSCFSITWWGTHGCCLIDLLSKWIAEKSRYRLNVVELELDW